MVYMLRGMNKNWVPLFAECALGLGVFEIKFPVLQPIVCAKDVLFALSGVLVCR